MSKSNKVKALRMLYGITQKELAEAVGISAPYLHDLENGHRRGTEEVRKRISEVLGADMSVVFPDVMKRGA